MTAFDHAHINEQGVNVVVVIVDPAVELGRALWSKGVSETPVISVGEHWFRGVAGLMTAGAQLRQAVGAQHPLAPAG